MPEVRSAESALVAITEIFYSDVTDRVAADKIGYILSEAGYGPHARKGPGPLVTGNVENGRVRYGSHYFTAQRLNGVVTYHNVGEWIYAPESLAATFESNASMTRG